MVNNVQGLLTVAGLTISICGSVPHKSQVSTGMPESQFENDANEDERKQGLMKHKQ